MQSNDEWRVKFESSLEAAVAGGWWTRKPAAERDNALGMQIGFYAKLAEPQCKGDPYQWWGAAARACGKAWYSAESDNSEEARAESPEQREQRELVARLAQAKAIINCAGGGFRFSIVSGLTMGAQWGAQWTPENASAAAVGHGVIEKLLPELENALPASDSDWDEIAQALQTGVAWSPLSWVEARLLSQAKSSAPAAAPRRI